jgi:hypothetical protein
MPRGIISRNGIKGGKVQIITKAGGRWANDPSAIECRKGEPRMKDKQNEIIPAEGQVLSLLQQAIERNVPVETLERLLNMRERLKAEWAREQFYQALSAFQSEVPEIPKTHMVRNKDGSIRYRYAPLDAILKIVQPSLQKHGFSYRFSTHFQEKGMMVTCSLHHQAGHQESSSFLVPVEREKTKDGRYTMSEIHAYGASLTYGKRYTFCAVTGIATAEEDTDAQETEGQQGNDARGKAGQKKREKKEGNLQKATNSQIAYIQTLFTDLQVREREQRLEWVKNIIQREITSSKELRKDEASKVIETLQQFMTHQIPKEKAKEKAYETDY